MTGLGLKLDLKLKIGHSGKRGNVLHVCNNDFTSFLGEAFTDSFSETRATSCDNGYLAFKAVTEDLGVRVQCVHVVDLVGV